MNACKFVFVLLVVLLPGCAVLRPLTTSPVEYNAYRATRVSPTLEGRLVAASRYLKKYPNGAFVEDVRAQFDMAEPLYFEANRSRSEGLHSYLVALPEGPHADEAKQRLHVVVSRLSGPIGFDSDAIMVDARIGKLAATRAAARNEILDTLRRFLDRETFGRPLSEAKTDLLVAWSLVLPRPRCSLDDAAKGGPMFRCVKLLELPYELSIGEGRTEQRQATVEIVVLEDRFGRPTSVTMGGSDLFLRLDETFTGRVTDRDDTRDSSRALTRAVELVRQEFSSRISDDVACRKPARGAELGVHACLGVRISVLPGLEPGEDDRIQIVPTSAD